MAERGEQGPVGPAGPQGEPGGQSWEDHVTPFNLVVIVTIIIAFALVGYGINKVQKAASSNQRALCSLKNGYQGDANDAVRGVLRFPNGIPSLGVTTHDLVVRAASLQGRADDLGDVHCKVNVRPLKTVRQIRRLDHK